MCCIFFIAIFLFFSLSLSAQETGPNPVYKRGETVLERTLPPSPEAASRVKYADVPFTHSQGAAEYSVEFSTLKGRELQIPIELHYRSNGIKLDEIAGVAGLGWTLEAGGCITRTVMDMPDEYSALRMRHQMPSGTLLNTLVNNYESIVGNSPAQDFLRDIIWHRVDTQLDRYSYDFCGLSGSFVIRDNGIVSQLSGNGVSITFVPDETGAPGVFTIKGPDGTAYEFSAKETGEHDASIGYRPVEPGGELDKWTATTAWHLSRITSASGLESADFTYESAGTWCRDVDPWTDSHVTILNSPTDGSSIVESDPLPQSVHIVQNYDVLKLKSITLGEFSASFLYISGTGRDEHLSGVSNYPVRLTGIVLRHTSEGQIDSLVVGTARHSNDGRIVLNSLRRYRGGIQNDRWDFTYYERGRKVCRGSQDWYGYYNSEYEPDYHFVGQEETTSTVVCPFRFSAMGGFSREHGTPHPERATYMSLKSADHDGAGTRFEYEGNTKIDRYDNTSVGIRVKRIIVSDNGAEIKERRFAYDSVYFDGPLTPTADMYVTVTPPLAFGDMTSEDGRHTWVKTLHDTPVVIGPSIRDTRAYCRKVTETTVDSKTIYRYRTDVVSSPGDDPSYRFPSQTDTLYNADKSEAFDPWVGVPGYHYGVGPTSPALLVSKEDCKKESDDEWTRVSREEYDYQPESGSDILVSYIAHHVYQSFGVGNVEPSDIYHYPVSATIKKECRPSVALHVNYHPHGNDSTRVDMRYVARTSLSVPTRLASVESTEGGVTRRLEYTYPDTFGQSSGEGNDDEPEPDWARQLTLDHRLNTPVRTDWHVYSAGVTPSMPLRSERTEYDTIRIGNRLPWLPVLHREYYRGEECWREEIRGRDAWGNVSQVKEKGKPETLITWGYGGLYPTQITQDTLTTSYTWRPGIGLSSTTSPSGVVTRYEYDHAGRLSTIKDEQGRTLESWEYHLFNDGGDGHLSRRHRTYRSAGTGSGSYGEDITWWNTLGLRQQDNIIGGAGDGRDLVSAFGADALLHDDARVWLPYAAVTGGAFQESAEDEAAAFHGDSLAYAAKTYEKSAREKVLSEALPGYAGAHETQYTEDVCTTPFPRYVWVELTPATTGVHQMGSYATGEVVVATTTDADGRVRSTYTDHAGRTLGTSVGDDAPTYYIYDTRDQLRAVASSGIALSDTLSMWRYSYDRLGRLASKGIPGSVRERYTYDDEDRIIAKIRNVGYASYIEYDALNRPTAVRINGALTEEHQYAMDKEVGARLAIIDRSFITPTDELEYVQKSYLYDSRGRLITTTSTYPGGDVLTESTSYNLAGEVTGSSSRYRTGGLTMRLDVSNVLDRNGRLVSSSSELKRGTIGTLILSSATTQYSYDAIGRPCGKIVSTPDGETLSVADTLALQGWLVRRRVTRDGLPFFTQNLRHDEPDASNPGAINIGPSTVPSYTGLVTGRRDEWNYNRILDYRPEVFYYDYAGRLSEERILNDATTWTYDQRGNITSSTTSTLRSSTTSGYAYDGDRLRNIVTIGSGIKTFSHDQYGRMTRDGLSGTSTVYNYLDRPVSITDGLDTTRFVYLSDGTKLCVLNTEGEGLEYRGALVYRKAEDGALTLESARCPEGRLTPSAPLLYVEDHLGSIRAVIDGTDGSVLETSNYSAYGTRSEHSSSVLPGGLTLRDRYTGCEDLSPDFLIPYTDHQARLYSSTLSRWMAPDPLSEKYYGISPYAYCGGNPMAAVDRNGNWFETAWDIANVVMDVTSLAENIAAGNVGGAVLDAVGLVADVAAVAVPGLPGGAGTAIKGARTGKAVGEAALTAAHMANVADGAKTSSKIIDNTTDVAKKVHGNSKASTKAQHAYDIIDNDTGNVVKTGVSGGAINKDGKSTRAESQVSKWNKAEGRPRYSSTITHHEPSGPNARGNIYEYEKTRANELRDQLDPQKHKRP